MVRLIRTEEEHKRAVSEIDELIRRSPAKGSPDSDRLELLVLLVERYETERFPRVAPTPQAAIQFRMEQLGLTPRDLIPILGSRARVSEILSGSRALTLPMIRALNTALDIPTESLVSATPAQEDDIDSKLYPLKELVRRGWLDSARANRKTVEEALEAFLAPLGGLRPSVLFRRSQSVRASRKMNPYALDAWAARALWLANNQCRDMSSQPSLALEDLSDLFRLSVYSDGPRRAIDWLCARGIAVVVVPHLPGTWLDGAAMKTPTGFVIGMTIRHDRIDNFWFTLAHELIHVLKHLSREGEPVAAFFDDLDSVGSVSALEQEADVLASDSLVPDGAWKQSPVRYTPSPEAVDSLAKQLGIHPAIVAGRVRHERRNFRLLSKQVGAGEVSPLFASELGTSEV